LALPLPNDVTPIAHNQNRPENQILGAIEEDEHEPEDEDEHEAS